MQMKVPILGGKMSQSTFASKEEKQAPGFKADSDGLTIRFCANAAWFMISIAFIHKAANS